ncbi:MAG: hypothetical protein MI919_05525, partial [Holophagales bacterium]|nr:hypothetical protein [Holophagales bacterium]
MTLRARLFLVLGGLLTAFLAAQAWIVRSLSAEMLEELDSVAFTVGTSVAQVLSAETGAAECPRLETILVETLPGLEEAGSSDALAKAPRPHSEPRDRAGSHRVLRIPRKESRLLSGTCVIPPTQRAAAVTVADGSDTPHHTVEVWFRPEPRAVDDAEAGGGIRSGSSEDRASAEPGEVARIEATSSITVGAHWVTADGEAPQVLVFDRPPTGQTISTVVDLEGMGGQGSDDEDRSVSDVRLHLASQSGTSFLLVEKPDLVGRVPIPQSGWEEPLAELERRTLL